jgi:hypothetical protein
VTSIKGARDKLGPVVFGGSHGFHQGEVAELAAKMLLQTNYLTAMDRDHQMEIVREFAADYRNSRLI